MALDRAYRLVKAAVLAALVGFCFAVAGPLVHAQESDDTVDGVTVASSQPGQISVTWNVASPTPTDYRVTWKKSTAGWPSYRNANTAEGGNAFVKGTSHTVTGLEEGPEYQVRVRARYFDVNGRLVRSGPWSGPPVANHGIFPTAFRSEPFQQGAGPSPEVEEEAAPPRQPLLPS